MRKRVYIPILTIILALMCISPGTPDMTPPMMILSKPEFIEKGDDFILSIRTIPNAQCNIYMPIIALRTKAIDSVIIGQPRDFVPISFDSCERLFDYYIQADGRGIAQLEVPAENVPLGCSPDEPHKLNEIPCLITMSHPDYPEDLTIEISISYRFREPKPPPREYIIHL